VIDSGVTLGHQTFQRTQGHRHEFGEQIVSSPALAGNQLFLRGRTPVSIAHRPEKGFELSLWLCGAT